jgi:long-subunit fatty acid transport protein
MSMSDRCFSSKNPSIQHLFVVVAIAILASTFETRSALATNGASPTSSGGRAAGRGGADAAVADDATAVNTNPAGLAFIDGQRFDQTFAAFAPQLRWTNPTGTFKSKTPPPGVILGAAFGVAIDLDEPWKLGEALTFSEETYSETLPRTQPGYEGYGLKFGFGVFPLSGSLVDFEARSPFFSQQDQGWEADSKEVAVAVSVAWRPVHWIAFGISPEFVYSQLEFDQPATQPKAVLQGHPTGRSGATYADAAPFLGVTDIEGYSDVDNARTYGGRAKIGMLAIPAQWETGQFSIGLTYTTQTLKQDFLGTAFVDFNEQIRKVDPNGTLLKPAIASETGVPENQQSYAGRFNARISPLNLPQQVDFGLALAQSLGQVGILVAVDVRWINWSSTWKSLDLRLTEGESPELNELTGDDSGKISVVFPLDWRDQVVFAGGIAISPIDFLTLRAGYNYGRNPVPSNTVQPTTPAILEHHVSIGAGIQVRRLEISLAWEHAFENTVHVGRSISNRDVEDSTISVSLDAFALGFSVRF